MRTKVKVWAVTILREISLDTVADALENGRPAYKPQLVPIRVHRRIERPWGTIQAWHRPDVDPYADCGGCVRYRPRRPRGES